MTTDEQTKGLSLIWGASRIAAEIGVNERQCYYYLEKGALPAKKIGDRWVADRRELHRFFRGEAA